MPIKVAKVDDDDGIRTSETLHVHSRTEAVVRYLRG